MLLCGLPHVHTIQSTRCKLLKGQLFDSTFLLPVGSSQLPGKGSRLIFNYCWETISTNIWWLRRRQPIMVVAFTSKLTIWCSIPAAICAMSSGAHFCGLKYRRG